MADRPSLIGQTVSQERGDVSVVGSAGGALYVVSQQEPCEFYGRTSFRIRLQNRGETYQPGIESQFGNEGKRGYHFEFLEVLTNRVIFQRDK
jgi:hypothetical protein